MLNIKSVEEQTGIVYAKNRDNRDFSTYIYNCFGRRLCLI